jgi:predicted amidohydrolase
MIQSYIDWEDKAENLRRFGELLRPTAGQTHLAVLPEMFSTGFSMRAEALAESMTGETMSTVKHWASTFGIAVAGSFMAAEDGAYYNRAFFVTPEGATYHSDKRHLFGPGGEGRHYTAGRKRLIVEYLGWRICLLVCYDLRFPVWSRNVGNEYDLLIYTSNWPATRREAWQILLPARAVENMAFVCGVNRTGEDGRELCYAGGSMLCSPRGDRMAEAGSDEETVTCGMNKKALDTSRAKFPVWKDADAFVIS